MKDYIGWSGVLLFVHCETVTSCLYAHVHLLKCQKTILGDNCFNHKQVSDVYCIIINKTSLYGCESSRLVSRRLIYILKLYNGFAVALA